ncbi:Aste57867_5949 [Aphanomyces stellatus]|uniref:Aste57867_5949 protein n=1 Tax=Aphanomyces stellatus TaxID=120398 RepID=A0A485KHN4_9STRA|nr:hypothetical protein As57867_005935 [Aphanomyces stellatus]VFT82966.1 Aste57867_5949 [Aphanomyces stellatus]
MTSSQAPNAAYYIQHLDMKAHPEEGGYYSIGYRSEFEVDTPGRAGPARRSCYSTIHYMFVEGQVMFMHINGSDVSHFWQAGRAIRYYMVDPASDQVHTYILGPHVHKGHLMQFTCPGGWWKAAEVLPDDGIDADFALIGEAVGPAFHYADNYLVQDQDVIRSHAHLLTLLKPFLRPQGWVQPSPREPQADYGATAK